MDAEAHFEVVVEAMLSEPGVTPPSGGGSFGSATLRVDGKIFAMLAGGRLVVKLPSARVDELVANGHGARFDGNKGKPMKEWFSLEPTSSSDWRSLTAEALAHVRPPLGSAARVAT